MSSAAPVALLPLLLLPTVAFGQAHPLADCTVERGAIGYSTNITLFCGLAQVAVRRFPETVPSDTLLSGFEEELRALATQIGTEVTWNVAKVDIGGSSRSVAQYTLKGEQGVLRTGLVVPGAAASTTDVLDCSSADADAAQGCLALVDTALRSGMPGGATFLPFASEVRKSSVLGREVKVVLGCRAQFVFDDAINVICADGELMFGSQAQLSADGMAADPIDAIHEQLGGAAGGAEKACTVAGASTTCWTKRVTQGGVPIVVVTARPTVGGQKAELVCSWTAVGETIHPLCSQLLSF